MGIFGEAKDNFAMLRGAVEKGDLDFVEDSVVEPRMRRIMRERAQANPGPETKVTRDALRAFARKYSYKPKFLER
jgi:hypothetical protein